MAFHIRQEFTTMGIWGAFCFVGTPIVLGLMTPPLLEQIRLVSASRYGVDKNALFTMWGFYSIVAVTFLASVPMMIVGRRQIMVQVPDPDREDPKN